MTGDREARVTGRLQTELVRDIASARPEIPCGIVSEESMATTPPAKAATTSKKIAKPSEPKSPLFSFALLAGWLVPGAGHLLTRRWVRGGLLFAAIGLMFILGLLMQGKLYTADPSDPCPFWGSSAISAPACSTWADASSAPDRRLFR